MACVGNHEQFIRPGNCLFTEVCRLGRLLRIDAVLRFESLLAIIDQADEGDRCVANQCREVGDVVVSRFRHDIQWIASLRNR